MFTATPLGPGQNVHDIVQQVIDGNPPPWAVAGDDRLLHMERVAALLSDWAAVLGLPTADRLRWRAAGLLHDLLRDADPDELRDRVAPGLRELPGPILHGPAAAERLRIEGVEDGELLTAVAFHTVGDDRFGALGRALYAADFLEPGRTFLPEWRQELRGRMPEALDEVVREIVGARIGNCLDRGAAILSRTVAFWNQLAQDQA